MSTPTVRVDPVSPAPAMLASAGAILRRGGLVAFPTESFYGLGADAGSAAAVARVFTVKGRPDAKPLLVLVDGIAMVERLAADVPPRARELMARHWPGPLTLILRAVPELPAALTAGTGTVGVRMPGHAVALALVRAAGRPVTAPSANPSGAPPPTTAEAVCRDLGPGVDLVVDAGPTAGGPASTIADCTVWPPRIVREGPVVLR
ncbi:MAG: threonylcarbamoyl-AMP synthase [Candidatus Rokubacteria bacterium]|nr:threonylcarbamoyl-AMP synthase [Candidatus Rokubacteria bacterium]